MLLFGENYFLLEYIPFQKGSGMQENKQEVTKVVCFAQTNGKNTKCSHSVCVTPIIHNTHVRNLRKINNIICNKDIN